MLLKSKSRTAPTSEAARASRARPSRYVRRRSTFQRSSQSTLRMPGDGNALPIAVESVDGRVSTALTAGTSGRVRSMPRSGAPFNTDVRMSRPAGTASYHRRQQVRPEVLVVGSRSGAEAPAYSELGDRLRTARAARGLSL